MAFSIQAGAAETTWMDMLFRAPFLVFVFLFPFLVPRLLAQVLKLRSRIHRAISSATQQDAPEPAPLSILIIACLVCAAAARLGGIDPSIGAFFGGIGARACDQASVQRAHEHFREIVMAYFAPVYFFLVGLNLHLGENFILSQFVLFLFATSALKIIGAFVSARFNGLSTSTAITFGVCMNARGGPGIVLATTALAAGAISSEFACTLILSAVVTSVLAALWLGVARQREPLLTLTPAP